MRRFKRVIFSRRFLLVWAGVFVALIGLLSSLAQLFSEIKLSLTNAVILILVSGIASGIYALVSASPVHLPVDDIVPQVISNKPCMSLIVTTDRKMLLEANRLAASSYIGVTPLPTERYEQWLMVNPTILTCLLDSSEAMVGYFDMFPFDSKFFAVFIEGLCGENEIRREHILPVEQARKTERLYLGGVAVANPQTMKGKGTLL